MFSHEPVEKAMSTLGSVGRWALMWLMATAPMPPGMFWVRMGLGTRLSSESIRVVRRQVTSKPPPGAAGAMHSAFCGVKPWAWAAQGRAAAAVMSMRRCMGVFSLGAVIAVSLKHDAL